MPGLWERHGGPVCDQAAVFSDLVASGEVLVGLALIAGLFTRLVAFWGAFLNLLFMLAGSSGVNRYRVTIERSFLRVGTIAGLIGLDLVVLPFVWSWAAGRRPSGTGGPRSSCRQVSPGNVRRCTTGPALLGPNGPSYGLP